jgi:uncharacterized coiled-coil protein SlyX
MSSSESPDRLERIESALTHLQHQFDSLNEVVLGQERRLTRMERLVKELRDNMETQEMERIRANQTKPPHYAP